MKKILYSILTAALILTGCSTENPSNSAPSTPPSASAVVLESPQVERLPDPRSLTGVSYVPEIGDPEVIDRPQTPVLPVEVTDHEGNRVHITDVSRILALDINGTISRTVIALGLGDNLVGRTVSSTESVLADLPVVTENGHSLNGEAILALNPTVILADRSVGPPEVIDQLRAASVPVVLVDPHRSLQTTGDLINHIAAALGVADSGRVLAARTEAEIASARAEIAQWVPAEPLDIAFLYVRGTGGIFFILGTEDGAGELISAVGANDVAGAEGIVSATPANAEAIAKLDPDVIFVMTHGLESTEGLEGLMARPGVAQTKAGKNQRVVAIPDGISLSFGPQSGQIITEIARATYGLTHE